RSPAIDAPRGSDRCHRATLLIRRSEIDGLLGAGLPTPPTGRPKVSPSSTHQSTIDGSPGPRARRPLDPTTASGPGRQARAGTRRAILAPGKPDRPHVGC